MLSRDENFRFFCLKRPFYEASSGKSTNVQKCCKSQGLAAVDYSVLSQQYRPVIPDTYLESRWNLFFLSVSCTSASSWHILDILFTFFQRYMPQCLYNFETTFTVKKLLRLVSNKSFDLHLYNHAIFTWTVISGTQRSLNFYLIFFSIIVVSRARELADTCFLV